MTLLGSTLGRMFGPATSKTNTNPNYGRKIVGDGEFVRMTSTGFAVIRWSNGAFTRQKANTVVWED